MKIKAKVPKEVGYGCHKYRVALENRHLTGNYGDVDHLLQELAIRNDLPPSRKLVAFVHENIHIIEGVFNIGLDEHQVELLGEGIGQLFANLGIELDWSDIPTKTAVIKEAKEEK